MRPASELPAFWLPLLEALRFAHQAVLIVVDRAASGIEWLYINECAAELFGYSVEEMAKTRPVDLLALDERENVKQMSENFRNGQAMPTSLEFRARKKDGTPFKIEAAISPMPYDGGLASTCIAREIQERPLNVSLLEADRIALVGALAAGFAHEINNPLTSVLLNLRSLRKQITATMPEGSQKNPLRCIDDVTTGAERIASNVRALQTLATRSETQSLDLAAVVSASLRLATPTLEPRAHVIRQIFPVRPVMGEESRLGQAVLAMLLFSSSGFPSESSTTSNRIVVAVEERDGHVVVEVSDNGRDPTPDEVEHAFDPFFRSSARGAGVGVGLGIARSVATALHGQVALAARPGGGAVITMKLPAA